MSKVKLDKYFRCSAEVHSGKELHLEVVPWGLVYLEWCSGLFRMDLSLASWWFSDSKSTFPIKHQMSFSCIWSKNQVYDTTESISALCWGYSNRCSRTYPEVQLLPDVDGIARFLVRLGEVLAGWSDSMKRDLGEPGSENLEVWLYCQIHPEEKSEWLKHQWKGATNKQLLLRECAVNWFYSFPTAGCISGLSEPHTYQN